MERIAARGRRRRTAGVAAGIAALAASVLLAPTGGAAKDDTTLISIAQVVPGGKANALQGSTSISVSDDGRYVAFQTQATNLVAEDTNGDDDIYVRDTVAETTTLVTPGDGPDDASGLGPAISDDGQRVAFTSSDQLDSDGDDTNQVRDVYVYDFGTDEFTLVSRPMGTGPGGTVAIVFSTIAISGDGNVVAFSSRDNTLDPVNDSDVVSTGAAEDVFVRELDTNTTELVSRDDAADGNLGSLRPSLDDDGSHVGFDTASTNLDGADTDGVTDVYVRNRNTSNLILVSRANGGGAKGNGGSLGPSLSADGQEVAFASTATNLDPADTDSDFDIYLREIGPNQTELISHAIGPGSANKPAQLPTISGDGIQVAFISAADNLHPDQNQVTTINQAYVRDRATDTTRLESRADGLDGPIANDTVREAAISSDGADLAFSSDATNLDLADSDTIIDAYVRDMVTGETQLASQSPRGAPVNANGESRDPSISADGGLVAFTSAGTNIDPAATNNRSDIFVRDTTTGGVTVLASRADGADGLEGDEAARNPSISADGRFVAFESDTAFAGIDADTESDIYVRDLIANTTRLVSVDDAGANVADFTAEPSISGDGMRVAFETTGVYDAQDTNGIDDVYVRDLATDQTLLVSRPDGAGAGVGDDGSHLPDISADGSAVTFESRADNLTADPDPAPQQVFVRRIGANQTILASRAGGAGGVPGNVEAREPTISGDGSVVAFQSDSSNLDPEKTTTTTQIFLRDLDALTTDVVSRADGASGAIANDQSTSPDLSDDGTYVAFQSGGTNLDPAATNTRPDVFLRDLAAGETTLASRADGPAGAEGNEPFGTSDDPSVSEHGRFVAFDSSASNFDPADTDTEGDVYLRDVLGPDTTAPVTAITGGPAAGSLQNTNAFNFTFTVDEPGSTSECRLDGGAFAPCVGTFGTGALGDGQHTFEVRSTDRAGNVEAPAPSRTFTVDTLAPDTSLIAPPEGPISSSTPSFDFNSTEPGATFECSLDGGAFSGCASGTTAGPLADGDHSFAVRSTDLAGNVDLSPATTAFSVDTVAPDTTLTSPPQGTIPDATPTLSFSSPDPGATFRCAVDGGAFGPCSSGLTLSPLADGAHTFAVRAIDPAGNLDQSPATAAFNVDTAISGREVSAKDKQKQRGGKVKVVAKLATGEAVTATLTGKVKGMKLNEVEQDVDDGKGAKLTGKLDKNDSQKVFDLIDDGKEPKAKLTVEVVDAVGNTDKSKLKVRLKG